MDYLFDDPASLGVKLRWVDLGRFTSERVPWDQLRSHESSTGRGDAVYYQMRTDDTGFWGVSLSLRYQF